MSKLPVVAIIGRANVGKSSLFNAILNRREAIVAQEAGTTRDAIYAKAKYNEHEFWLVDTAGMKTPEDDFELTIQEQITEATAAADVIWVVIDATTILSEEDRKVAKMALKSQKPVFLLINKSDKKTAGEDFRRLGIKHIFRISASQRAGLDELQEALAEVIPKTTSKEDSGQINVALLGRPNVGKSSLFNALAKKQQAIVAEGAGTTRDVNRIDVKYQGRTIHFMDTAGIRRSGKIGQGIERFSVIRALHAIEQSDVCLMLMDANELNVTLDQKIAGIVKEADKGLVLIVSKWDSLDKDAYTRDQLAPQIVHSYDFVPWAPLIFTSAKTGQNVTKIFDIILDIDSERRKSLKTPELNRWLKETVNLHPPAGLKNRQPKLNYIIQEEDNPTNFKIYGSQTKFLHWSYKRFMEREFRQKFGFNGTAIKFWFFEKRESHKHGDSPTKARNKRIRQRAANNK